MYIVSLAELKRDKHFAFKPIEDKFKGSFKFTSIVSTVL